MDNLDSDGRTPTLRFPKFEDGGAWQRETLRRLALPVKDKATGGDNEDTLTLSGEMGLVPQGDYFGKQISGENVTRYIKILRNDFVYNDRTTKASKFGSIKRLTSTDGGIVSPIYKCFRFEGGQKPDFWDYYFEAQAHEAQLGGLVNEGARAGRFNISINKFLSIAVWKPSSQEQERIAGCLASIDALIEAEAEKLDALKDHKQGLMQQVFPAEGETVPELRFPEFQDIEEWSLIPLADLLLARPDYGLNAASVPYDETLPVFLRITDISEDGQFIEESKVSTDATVSDADFLEFGQIVLARTGASVGKSYAYREEDGEMVHAGYLIRIRPNPKLIDHGFLVHFLSSPSYWNWVAQVSGRGAQPGINSSQYSELLIPVPPCSDGDEPLEEQARISKALTSISDAIHAQKVSIETLQNHKQGLLQQLFPTLDEVHG